MNKAVPGLFPEMTMCAESSSRRNTNDDRTSIDTQMFQQVYKMLPADYEAQLSDDRFYLSKLYLSLKPNGLKDLYSDNFDQFDKNCDREIKLRDRLEKLITTSSNSGVILPQLSDVNAVLSRTQRTDPRSNDSWLTSLADFFNIRRNENCCEQFVLALQDVDSSCTSTAVIDETGPELDFIDYKFEKKAGFPNVREITMDFDDDPPIEGRGKGRPYSKPTLQRKLKIRHLQMISLGATIGVGLFLNSGKAFSIAGPMGAFLGFLFGGLVIMATLFSFAEMVALIPLISGISGLCSRFVGDSFGFTVGWCHWVSYASAFPSELIATAIMLSYYNSFSSISTSNSIMAATLTLMIIFLTAINLLDVRIYGELEYIMSAFKLVVIILLLITVIILNAGGFNNSYIGFRFWTKDLSPSPDITFGPFRPTFDLNDYGDGANTGVGGIGGIVLSCIVASLTSTFSYIGSEIGFIAASEAQNPRKAVPSVTKRIFVRVVVFYLLSIFVVGMVIYSGDPRLLRIIPSNGTSLKEHFENYQDIIDKLGGSNCETVLSEKIIFNESSNQSPWVIAFKSFKQCTLAGVVNAFFVCVGLSSASSQLYASSRTLYAMATQNKAPGIFTKCTEYGNPYVSVLFCGSIGFAGLLCLNLKSTESLLLFINFGITGAVIMWFGMNVSFLRFFYALRKRPDIIDRNAKEYPYKSPFQPYLAIFGIISTLLLLLLNGIQNFFSWNTLNFISSYCNIGVFFILYFGYTWVKGSNINNLEQIDLDSGRREMDRIIWKEDVDYSLNLKEFLHKVFSYV